MKKDAREDVLFWFSEELPAELGFRLLQPVVVSRKAFKHLCAQPREALAEPLREPGSQGFELALGIGQLREGLSFHMKKRRRLVGLADAKSQLRAEGVVRDEEFRVGKCSQLVVSGGRPIGKAREKTRACGLFRIGKSDGAADFPDAGLRDAGHR